MVISVTIRYSTWKPDVLSREHNGRFPFQSIEVMFSGVHSTGA